MRLTGGLVVVLLGVTVIGWALPESAKRPVSLSVMPSIGMAGGGLCVKVLVPRHADNRILATAVDCDAFFRSWQEQLNGESGPYERRNCFDNMPPGQCAIGAAVYRLDASQKDGVAIYRAEAFACFAGGEAGCGR